MHLSTVVTVSFNEGFYLAREDAVTYSVIVELIGETAIPVTITITPIEQSMTTQDLLQATSTFHTHVTVLLCLVVS